MYCTNSPPLIFPELCGDDRDDPCDIDRNIIISDKHSPTYHSSNGQSLSDFRTPSDLHGF